MRFREAIRFVVLGLASFVALTALVYFPYDPTGIAARALDAHLELQATVCGALIRLFDPTAVVEGTLISGRFAVRIVLECSAAEAHALFAAFVLAFPSAWRQKLVGVIFGIGALTVFNFARIAGLYFVGLHWPALFTALHEEVLAFALVLVALLAFVLWVKWAVEPRGTEPAPGQQ